MLDVKALGDYRNWIGQTSLDIYNSVIAVGGWQNVFPGNLPRWASRIRQYFNLNPMSLKLLNSEDSSKFLASAQTAMPASARATARRNSLQSRGMGISFYAPGSSTAPGTPLVKPDPNAPIDSISGEIGTMLALSGDVYEDELGRSIWFQMSPGAGIYHYDNDIRSPTASAILATYNRQSQSPVFKLICPDGTGGSRECVIKNLTKSSTIGDVDESVDISGRHVTHPVYLASYNYAETIVKGLPAHQRLDVNTDPMQPTYFVPPYNLFIFSELYMRKFPETDGPGGKALADQTENAP